MINKDLLDMLIRKPLLEIPPDENLFIELELSELEAITKALERMEIVIAKCKEELLPDWKELMWEEKGFSTQWLPHSRKYLCNEILEILEEI